jgi:AbrB family looped-hinge helix DNA binding protein
VHLFCGPRRISSVRQVAIPEEILDSLSLRPGDSVYLQEQEDGSILLVPAALLHEWIEKGQRSTGRRAGGRSDR